MDRPMIRMAVIFALAAMWCTAAAGGPLPAGGDRTIRVGVFDLEPLTCTHAASNTAERSALGLIFEYIAKKENWRVKIVSGTLEELEHQLAASRIDLLLAAPFARGAPSGFQYTRQSIVSTWAHVYTADGADIRSLLDLDGKSIGVARHSPYNPAFRRLLKQFNIQGTIVECEHPDAVFEGVSAGWIDAGAVDRFFGVLASRRYPVQKTQAVFSPIELRVAAPPAAKRDLLDAIDYHLTVLKADSDSMFHRLLNRALITPGRSRALVYLSWGLAVAAAATLLFGGITVLLRHQVQVRTRALVRKESELREELRHRRIAEKAARANELRYRSLFNNTGTGMILFDEDLRIHAANAMARRLAGLEKARIIRSRWHLTDFILTEVPPPPATSVEAKTIGGLPVNREMELQIRDGRGRIRDILGRINPIPDSGQYIASFIDITERIHNRAERIRLATAIEQSTDSIFITDRERRIIYANAAFEQMTGHSRASVMGRTPDFLWVDANASDRLASMMTHLRSGRTWRGRITNRRKDGALFNAQTVISPIRDRHGAITEFVNVKRDISAELRLENQLVEAQKMQAVGTLAGGIAHDFNNILAAIMGYTEITLCDMPEGAPARRNLQQVLGSCDRAKDLITQILTFSRKTEATLLPVTMGVVVAEALRMLRATLPANIRFNTDLSDRSAVVLANPTQLHQVVLNLCTNAAYAMKDMPSGDLSVSLTSAAPSQAGGAAAEMAADRVLLLTVSDSGVGMDKDTLQRLFEPFYTTKPKGEGTGLGLSVVHGIVRSHGGVIDVESAPGDGTTFRIYLPQASATPHRTSTDAGDVIAGSGQIVLIDDEKMIAASLKTLLMRHGYQVSVFNQPKQALAAVQRDPRLPDLVITDYHMPEMDGLCLAARLSALRRDLPIVLITGNSADLNAERLAAAGVRKVLNKPFQYRELVLTVAQLLAEATPTCAETPLPGGHLSVAAG